MWIVKLGGSLLDYHGLPMWLDVIANTDQPVVIVVGGGQLADAVRNAQKQWRFTDAVAHHLALIAIEHNVHFLATLDTRLVSCANLSAIEQCLEAGKVPVWLPEQMVMAASDIVPDWTMTSDSLSAWLVSQLSAEGLLLVKSCAISSGKVNASRLVENDIVDQAFPRMVQSANYPIRIMQRDNYGQLEILLRKFDLNDLKAV